MWCLIKYFEIITFTLLLKISAMHTLESVNDVVLVTKDYCVTNGEYAIAVNPPPEETENSASKFYSASNTDLDTTYSCKIGEDETCSKDYCCFDSWTLSNSIEGEIKEELMDHRWEDLLLYKTHHLVEDSDDKLEFKEVFRSLNIKNDFVISVSIRIQKDAHIFLCEDYVTKSRCYWVMLQAWKGETSAIRKCDAGSISKKERVFPQGTCKERRDSYEHTSTDAILDSTIWTHFTITRKNGIITVWPKEKSKPLLTFADISDPISPTRIFFHSKYSVGLWKLHRYSYMYSSVGDSTFAPLGPEFLFQKGFHCLAIFTVMCSNCKINIKIETKDNTVFEGEIKTEDEKWKERKIMFETEEGKFLLYVLKSFSGTHLKPFWAISRIRPCGENEYRILKLPTENAQCQIVSNRTLVAAKGQNTVTESGLECPEDTFGTSCIPCNIFGRKYCNSFKYCELQNGKNICSCSSGYESNTCNEMCPERYYGHSCKKVCQNCLDSCYSINGICNTGQCTENFTGEKCDQPPLPLLVQAPDIDYSYITSSSCMVFINNTEVIGDGTPTSYSIQYKESTSNTWKTAITKLPFPPMPKYHYIRTLEADTKYCVRVLLYTFNQKVYNGSTVKERCFQTTCTPYRTDNIIIVSTNISANVTIQKSNGYWCKISNYKYSIGDGQESQMEERLYITALDPNRQYVFNLRHPVHGKISMTFSTKEGVPGKVKNLKAISYSSNAFLSWKEPEVTYGRVKYVVMHCYLKSRSCATSTYKKCNNSTVSDIKTQLSDLKPYSKYEVKVAAKTGWAVGEFSSIIIKTNTSEHLTNDEFPQIQNNTASTNEAAFILLQIKCEDMQGPIYLKFEAKCQSSWCNQDIHNTSFTKYNYNVSTYSVKNLSSYTHYSVVIEVSRSKNDWSTVKIENIYTKPSVPNKIKDIQVTSKDEKSISLRWIPPFPPTGALAKYKISYNEFEHTQNIEQCKLWPDYHCATIAQNIKSRKRYDIKLFARNEDPADYARISKLFGVTATVEKPQPPYDVVGTWTESDNFKVSWKHPNLTNGRVEKFVIKIEKGQNFTKYIESEEDYNLTYTYLINQELFKPCTENVGISVTIHNTNFNAKSKTIYTTTPPPAPHISNSTIRMTNGTDNTFYVKISNIYAEESSNIFTKEVYILISSEGSRKTVDKDMDIFEIALKNSSPPPNLKNARIIKQFKDKEIPFDTNIPINASISNDKVKRIYIFFVNKCKGKSRIAKIEKNMSQFDGEDSYQAIYALLLLLLLIPLIAYLYIYKFRKRQASERTLLSFIQREQKKDIEELPLSEPATPNNRKPPTIVPKPASRSSVKKTNFSKPIKIVDFEMYVKQSIESGELQRQHEKFPRGQTKPWEYGALKVNKPKNRYNNLIAYDHTRVKLAKIQGNEYSDYINANYIDGYRIPRAYIATQGPKSTTLDDFWRMVWQEKVKHIVMLANICEGGKKKVEKYWPNINEEMNFNGIKVQYISSKVFANYEHRVFKASYKTEHREVTQLHFTSWPDHGVPLYPQSLVPFLQQVLKIPNNTQSPVIVHCSAGVGRTGTIILCDICLRMAAGEGSIDFLVNLEYLRSQRPNMVDNIEQYKLAHLVVLDCLFGMHTSIPCDENMNKTVKNILESEAISNQMRYLSETEWQDRAMDTVFEREEMPMYPEKNRFQHIVPDKNYRICLNYYPYNDESSSYINAVQVDGFRNPGRFIVTQQPLPNTLGDFWRMVWERQCTVIVSLNEIDPNDKSTCSFWPTRDADLAPVDYLTISFVKINVLECYQIITVEAINAKENESMEIKIIVMRDWKPKEILPSSIENFLLFWEEYDILSRKCNTVIVTCHDGSTASGLFIATTFLIDKMKLEQECDVCLAVRTIRHNRKEFVSNKEQFAFLYSVAVMYIDGFQSYANFA